MTVAGHSLDMTSVADLVDGRLIHTLFALALEQRSMDFEGFQIILYSLVSFHKSFMWLHQSKIHIYVLWVFCLSH